MASGVSGESICIIWRLRALVFLSGNIAPGIHHAGNAGKCRDFDRCATSEVGLRWTNIMNSTSGKYNENK